MGTDRDIPEGSLADRILEARRTPERERRRARERLNDPPTPDPRTPAAVVFERPGTSGVATAAAVVCALILHGGVLAAASMFVDDSEPSPRDRPDEPLQVRHVVDLEQPPEPEPPQPEPEAEPENPPPEKSPDDPPAPEPDPPEPSDPPESEPSSTESSPPPEQPAAEAADVADAKSNGDLVDFTANSGDSDSFAGGVTASDGTSDEAVESDDATGDGEPAGTGDGSGGARPVGLDRDTWDCPWPEQARGLSVDEQVVVLRAVVRPDGSPRSVTIVSDPGFGFGEAARECARSHTFRPAVGEDGSPRTAKSPPIRVRFTR